MQVQSLGGENPLEEEMATHSRLENPVDRGAQRAAVHGGVKSRTRLGTHGTAHTAHTCGGVTGWFLPQPLREEPLVLSWLLVGAASRGPLGASKLFPALEASSLGLFCISASPASLFSLIRTPVIVFRIHLNTS